MDSNIRENILKELTNFEKRSEEEIEQIPELLEKYLNIVARSGDIVFKWEQFKPLVKKKIEIIATEFNEAHPYNANLINQPNVKSFDFEEIKRNILSGIDSFTGAPFTIQRICELLIDPYRHYKRSDKFMKGLEKNVMVISEETVDQRTENGNTSSSLCLNSTFTLPSTSDSINQLNGYKENEAENQTLSLHNNQLSSTIQQLDNYSKLDSFTAVFVSSSQQNPLERIANLPVLESTTNACLALSSSSSLTPISLTPNITITPISDQTTLENLGKITTEQQQAHQSAEQKHQEHSLVADQLIATKTNVIIENLNTEEQEPSFGGDYLQGTDNNEKEEQNKNEDQEEKLDSSNNFFVEEAKENNSLNEDLDNQLIQSVKTKDEKNKDEETIEQLKTEENIMLSTIKKEEELIKSPIKINELKRVCDSPEIEPIKRFKSDLNKQKKEIELNQEETVEQNLEDKLISEEENLENNQKLEENVNKNEEEKGLINVDQQQEITNQQKQNKQSTDNDKETDKLEESKQIRPELLDTDDNQQEDTPSANELVPELQKEDKKDPNDTN